MPTAVTDPRSSPQDQIAHAAAVIGGSKHKRAVFEAVYRGRKQRKSVTEIVKLTRIARQQVLNAGKELVNNHIINQGSKGREPFYEKDPFYSVNRRKILTLAGDPKKLRDYPTKAKPRIVVEAIPILLPRQLVQVHQVTINEIDSFSAVRAIGTSEAGEPPLERHIKRGFQCILGETGIFRDWGGERNDLWSTRLRLDGKRRNAAVAFKGRGTRGKLTPRKMGRNGDQIQRLFRSEAEVFIVQYWGQIDESVAELMRSLATARSALEGRRVWFAMIDGDDTARLMNAYPDCF